MSIYQLTGLSGSGKTTITRSVATMLGEAGFDTAIVDGDEYRKTLCKDLGFSKNDRQENIRRLGAAAIELSRQGKIVLISAINPYEAIRQELGRKYGAKTVWIKCRLETLIERDTRGLYRRALLPDDHSDKLFHFTGINDVYEEPGAPHLLIDTRKESIPESSAKFFKFIMAQINDPSVR